MNQSVLTTLVRRLALVFAGGLVLIACGNDDSSDDDTSSDAQTTVEELDSSSDDSGDAGGNASSGDATSGGSNLLVPLDYLQGTWCDNEGTTWTIDGETAQLDDGAGGTGQMPINVLFLDVPGALVAQSDNEFVFNSGGDEVTFTRGSC